MYLTIGALKRLSTYLAGQLKNAVSITGGAIDGAVIGGTTPAAVTATTLTANTAAILAGFKFSDVGTIAAAGSNQGTATAIANQVTYVTAADGTKGVILPAATAGAVYVVYSTVATNGLPVYPATGDDINDGTTNAAVTIEGKTMAVFVAMDDTTWGAIYTADT